MCVCVFSADNRNVGFFDRLCGFRRVTTDSNMASVPSSSNTEKHSEPTSTGTESSTDDILSVSIEAVEDQVAKAGSYCQYINDENGIFW